VGGAAETKFGTRVA